MSGECPLRMNSSHADVLKWRRSCQRATHALLWAATTDATIEAGSFRPLSKEQSNLSPAELIDQWAPRVRLARSSGFHAALAAASGNPGKAGIFGSNCAGGELEAEGAVAGVTCAMVFEVVGQGCGLLPEGGWKRARGLFEHVTVRTPLHDHDAMKGCWSLFGSCPPG
jgi:hypothetical protein